MSKNENTSKRKKRHVTRPYEVALERNIPDRTTPIYDEHGNRVNRGHNYRHYLEQQYPDRVNKILIHTLGKEELDTKHKTN